jgi:Fe-S-cluster-containing dehydrogenase component/anaerobic selenocysteine-containing dehydrogenase
MSNKSDFQNEKQAHWQSYDVKERVDLEAIQNQEFYTSPDPLIERIKSGVYDRKSFLQLMGASVAMTTLNCVRKPVEKIIPYVKQPEEIKHGSSLFYSSTCKGCSAGCGILVRTKDGRPLKLEGNPDHPLNRGALCASGQAEIFDLYDPERARQPFQIAGRENKEIASSWDALDAAVKKVLTDKPGKTRVLSNPINSSSTKEVIDKFIQSTGGGKFYSFSFTSPEAVIALANEKSYGKAIVPQYRFDRAKVIVSIDADFLGTWISPVEFTKQFSKRRTIKHDTGEINTLYSIESMPSVTGSNADLRVPIKAGDGRKVVYAIALALKDQGANVPAPVSNYQLDTLVAETGISKDSIQKIATSLWNAKGSSLVVAGGVSAQTEDAVDLQVAVNMLNSLLGNDGVTIDSKNPRSEDTANSFKNLNALIEELKAGEVGLLVINDINLEYLMPLAGWKDLLSKAGTVVTVSDRLDETAKLSHWLAPVNHFLESWGDAEPVKGVVSVQQPTIRPLFDTRSLEDMLLKWSGNSANFYSVIKDKYTAKLGGNAAWEDFLRKGVDGSLSKEQGTGRAFNSSALTELKETSKDVTVALYETVALGDGSGANNSMRQELPDPITKVTWDNFVAISPALALELSIQSNDLVKVKVGNEELTLPAQIQPAMHSKTIGIAIGYGRTSAGKVGNGVGQNAYRFVKLGELPQFAGMPVTISKTGKTYKLATTQDHHMMNPTATIGKKNTMGLLKPYDKDRPLIQSTTFDKWLVKKDSGIAEPEIPVILDGNGNKVKARGENKDFNYHSHKWGLNIDLTLCTGCAACVIACQVENNIPVVGRDEVRVGREMHWIRIDRYYIGDPEKPESMQIAHQPVMCQHCDNAPCETVCPVSATMHGHEGTNDMVYNRCVGTRYCSNNCPYKVRRFNWMNHWKGLDTTKAPRYLGLNPDVTVRSRGVMEKCTFCAGRVAEKKIAAKNEGRDLLKDGEVKTACQETCPAGAITFGNTKDTESKVAKHSMDERSYRILDFLNVKPAVSYLTRVRNNV